MGTNLDNCKREGLPPAGWHRIIGVGSVPKGWQWWSNGKSLASGEYKEALFRDF